MPFEDHVTFCVFHLFEITEVEARFRSGIEICLPALLEFQVLLVNPKLSKQNVNTLELSLWRDLQQYLMGLTLLLAAFDYSTHKPHT